MDVILETNSPDLLALREIRRFADTSDFVCQLSIRSRGFAAERDFYFTLQGLKSFVARLEAMDGDLRGTAELRTPFEDDAVVLEVLRLGRVLVRGDIHEHSEHSQHLAFSFETDQTCLGPFVRDLRGVAGPA